MHREGPQSRGRTKGGRRHQLESILAERCLRTPGPNMEMIGQRQPRKLSPCKQPKPPLWCVSHSESTCVFFHMYVASSKRFYLFHNLGLFTELFLQRRQNPRSFFHLFTARINVTFNFFNLLIRWITLIDVQILNQLCIYGINPT